MASSPEQEAALTSFTQLCAQHDLLARPDGLETQDLCSGLSDPPTLLRFLTAREFNPDAAFKQFQDASHFRQEKHVLRLYDNVEIADFEKARQFYPHWTGRRDKRGLPICMFDVSRLDKDNLACWEKSRHAKGWEYAEPAANPSPTPDMLQLASVYHDSLVRLVFPLCSMMTDRPNPSTAITSSLYLVDASSLGLKQGWSLKSFAQSISWLLSTCYPETIQRVFVCNVPSYFSTIWKHLKSWVDPYTAEKIVILSGMEVLPALQEYIEDANIPTAFGGGFNFTHGMLPELDNNISRRLGLSESSLPAGPFKWVEDSDGRTTALAVGSEGGSKRSQIVATIDFA